MVCYWTNKDGWMDIWLNNNWKLGRFTFCWTTLYIETLLASRRPGTEAKNDKMSVYITDKNLMVVHETKPWLELWLVGLSVISAQLMLDKSTCSAHSVILNSTRLSLSPKTKTVCLFPSLCGECVDFNIQNGEKTHCFSQILRCFRLCCSFDRF